MTKILDALRTPGAMLIALVLALVAQLEHTAQVFLQVVDANGIYAQAHAYAFAGAVEVAVLLFVLAGHQRISYGFALATFATNLSYYAMHGVPLLSVAGAPAWLMSLLLPAAIVGYSHTIADANPAAPEPDRPRPAKTPAKAPAPKATSTTTTNTPSEAPRPATPPSEAISEASETTETADGAKPAAPSPLTPAQRRAHIVEQELSDPAQVAAIFNVSRRTAQGDLAAVREAMTQTNGKVRA